MTSSDPRIAVITNNTNVDLTYYRWVNPLLGFMDNYAVSYTTIHPGESVTLYVYHPTVQAEKCKDKNGNIILVDGHEITRYLIARCEDVGAFYDVPSGAPTFEATVYYDAPYSRIVISSATASKMQGSVSYRDELPSFNPGPGTQIIDPSSPAPGWDVTDDEGMTEKPNLGESTSGNPTDNNNPFDIEKWMPYIIMGGVGIFALLFLLILLRR